MLLKFQELMTTAESGDSKKFEDQFDKLVMMYKNHDYAAQGEFHHQVAEFMKTRKI
jgi:hypothetical protein